MAPLFQRWEDAGTRPHTLGLRLFATHLIYMDDLIILAHSALQLQTRLHQVAQALGQAGLFVNLSKCAWAHNQWFIAAETLIVDSTELPLQDHITFLGSCFTPDGRSHEDLVCRLAAGRKAWAMWKPLSDHGLCPNKRANILRSAIGGALQWATVSWTVNHTLFTRLAAAERRCAAYLRPCTRRLDEPLGDWWVRRARAALQEWLERVLLQRHSGLTGHALRHSRGLWSLLLRQRDAGTPGVALPSTAKG
eukprot:6491818-Amphidinium_carterae.5